MSGTLVVDKSAYGKSALSHWGVADQQLTNKQAWLTFWCLFAFGASCVYQWQMMAPVLVDIAAVFNIPTADIGFLMSVYTFAGLVLAYPCTWVMQTFGIKFSLTVTAVLSIVGNLICLVSGDATMFLVGRVLQGAGFGLIAVLGPNIMPRLFPLEKQGLVMGIWSQWVTPGIALGALSTPLIFQAFGWQAIFYLSTAITVITALLVLVFVKFPCIPENLRSSASADGAPMKERKYGKTYMKSACIVGFSFVAWATVYGTYNSFFPTYAQEVLGMPMMSASMTTLVTALVTIPSGIAVGVLADRIRRRKVLLLAGYAILLLLYSFFMWSDTGTMITAWISAVVLGFICAGLIPTMTRAIIPVLAQKPKETDWALTGMAFVTQVGSLLATWFITIMATTGSWGTAGMVYGIAACVVALAVLFFIKDDHNIILTDE